MQNNGKRLQNGMNLSGSWVMFDFSRLNKLILHTSFLKIYYQIFKEKAQICIRTWFQLSVQNPHKYWAYRGKVIYFEVLKSEEKTQICIGA